MSVEGSLVQSFTLASLFKYCGNAVDILAVLRLIKGTIYRENLNHKSLGVRRPLVPPK